jgi:hypothetical protein
VLMDGTFPAGHRPVDYPPGKEATARPGNAAGRGGLLETLRIPLPNSEKRPPQWCPGSSPTARLIVTGE